MSELKTNKIQTNDTNNVAIDNAIGLKSYTTTQRDALTSVAGDIIYNTTDAVAQYYNGTSWQSMQDPRFNVDYVVIAGGGGGGRAGGGGGAGGYRASYNNESSGGGNSSETTSKLDTGETYTVTVGAGASGSTGGTSNQGSNSQFQNITATGGGGGGSATL